MASGLGHLDFSAKLGRHGESALIACHELQRPPPPQMCSKVVFPDIKTGLGNEGNHQEHTNQGGILHKENASKGMLSTYNFLW